MPSPTSTKAQLVMLMNDSLNQQFIAANYAEGDVTLGAPQVNTDTTHPNHDFNTVISATIGSGETQQVFTLHYNRLDIAQLLAPRGPSIDGDGTETSTHDTLPLVNAHIGFNLDVADVSDDLLTTVDADNSTITLKATATSLAVYGQGELNITNPPG